MLLAEASTSPIGASNHRATLLRISSLPTSDTSSAGTSVIASSTATILARKRANGSAPTPFDEQLDDVAGQDEHQRHDDREVGDHQRVENELGEEVGGQRGRAVGQHQQARPAPRSAPAMPARHETRVVEEGRTAPVGGAAAGRRRG